MLRAAFVVLWVGVAGALVACGGSSSECKFQDGTYAMKLTKTSGSCPEIPEQLFSQPDTSPGSDSGCHVTTNSAMCSLQITCKEMDAMTTTRVSGTASFASGAAVTGTVTVTVTNADASPGCTGTYNLSATKR